MFIDIFRTQGKVVTHLWSLVGFGTIRAEILFTDCLNMLKDFRLKPESYGRITNEPS